MTTPLILVLVIAVSSLSVGTILGLRGALPDLRLRWLTLAGLLLLLLGSILWRWTVVAPFVSIAGLTLVGMALGRVISSARHGAR